MKGDMMKTVNYINFNSIKIIKYKCSEPIKNTLKNNKNINIVSVFNNNGKQNLNDLMMSEQPIGDYEDWNVIFEDSSSSKNEIMDLKNEMMNLKSEVNGLKSEVNGLKTLIKYELVETKIRNIASNIVLYFVKDQPKPNKPSNRFGNKDSVNYKKLKRFIKGNNINYSTKKLGFNLDEMISERNVCIHPINLDELKEHVEKCIGYFNQFPELQDKYKTELFVVQNYDNFVKFI